MNVRPLAFLSFTLAFARIVSAQSSDNPQFKALREQLRLETEADIAANPNGKNAQEARKAAEAEKAAKLKKQAEDEKAAADQTASAAIKKEKDAKESAAQWAAGAPERERAAAAKKAAVDKWRASGKPAPSIIRGTRADGSITVMVDGKVSSFQTAAEADAFVESIRKKADTSLSY